MIKCALLGCCFALLVSAGIANVDSAAVGGFQLCVGESCPPSVVESSHTLEQPARRVARKAKKSKKTKKGKGAGIEGGTARLPADSNARVAPQTADAPHKKVPKNGNKDASSGNKEANAPTKEYSAPDAGTSKDQTGNSKDLGTVDEDLPVEEPIAEPTEAPEPAHEPEPETERAHHIEPEPTPEPESEGAAEIADEEEQEEVEVEEEGEAEEETATPEDPPAPPRDALPEIDITGQKSNQIGAPGFGAEQGEQEEEEEEDGTEEATAATDEPTDSSNEDGEDNEEEGGDVLFMPVFPGADGGMVGPDEPYIPPETGDMGGFGEGGVATPDQTEEQEPPHTGVSEEMYGEQQSPADVEQGSDGEPSIKVGQECYLEIRVPSTDEYDFSCSSNDYTMKFLSVDLTYQHAPDECIEMKFLEDDKPYYVYFSMRLGCYEDTYLLDSNWPEPFGCETMASSIPVEKDECIPVTIWDSIENKYTSALIHFVGCSGNHFVDPSCGVLSDTKGKANGEGSFGDDFLFYSIVLACVILAIAVMVRVHRMLNRGDIQEEVIVYDESVSSSSASSYGTYKKVSQLPPRDYE